MSLLESRSFKALEGEFPLLCTIHRAADLFNPKKIFDASKNYSLGYNISFTLKLNYHLKLDLKLDLKVSWFISKSMLIVF